MIFEFTDEIYSIERKAPTIQIAIWCKFKQLTRDKRKAVDGRQK